MIVGRFPLRVILVPLGASLAVLAVVLLAVDWNRFAAAINADRDGGDFGMAQLLLGLKLMWLAGRLPATMLMPVAFGALIAEIFAIRSWIFHVANGGISAWVGANIIALILDPADLDPESIIVIGAGIVGGFVYWVIAGRKAGFSRAAERSTS